MFRLTKLSLLPVLLLAMMFLVTSCDEDLVQEDITPNTPTMEVQSQLSLAVGRALPPANNASVDSMCFTFNFPLELALEDGTTITVVNEDALNDAFLDAEVSDNLVTDFVYPLSLTLADGSETSVDDFEALLEVLIGCFGDFEDWDDEDWEDEGDWNDHGDCPGDFDFAGPCFDLVFPITVISGAGETEIADEEAFGEFLVNLNPTDSVPFRFAFPFFVQLSDGGSIVEINSEEDLDAVLDGCDFGDFGDWDDDLDDYFGFGLGAGCFEINFPLTLSINDQSITISSEEDLLEILGNLEQDAELEIELEFPVSITLLNDESVVTVNSEEELEEAIEDACDFDGGDWDDDDYEDWDFSEGYGCFEVNFPLNLSVNGEVVTINSEEDFVTVLTDIDEADGLEIELVYPVTVTVFSDSTTVVINSEEEWEALCDACHFDGGNGDFDGECFTINFPLNVLIGGETVSVESEEGLESIFIDMNPGSFGGFAFPLTVTITDSGEVVTVNNEEEFATLAQHCE
jgi:hypothetical protein